MKLSRERRNVISITDEVRAIWLSEYLHDTRAVWPLSPFFQLSQLLQRYVCKHMLSLLYELNLITNTLHTIINDSTSNISRVIFTQKLGNLC